MARKKNLSTRIEEKNRIDQEEDNNIARIKFP